MKLNDFNKKLKESSKFNIKNSSQEIDIEAFSFNENYKTPFNFKRFAFSAMSLTIIFVFTFYLYVRFTPISTLTIDINPSLEVDVNRFNRVISIEGLDQESNDFIASLDSNNKKVEDLLEVIYEEGMDQGYFTNNDAYALIGIYANNLEYESRIDNLINQNSDITFLTISSHDSNSRISITYFDNTATGQTPEVSNDPLDGANDANDIPAISGDREDLTNLTEEEFETYLQQLNISVTKLLLILDIYNYYTQFTINDLQTLADSSISYLYNLYNSIE